jgi:phosphoribosylanthranilate isomerase
MTLPLLTMTGIDARTDPTWIKAILKRNILKSGYSGLEFAILRSPKVDQSPRYPNRDVIKRLISSAKSGDFAFHLCGRYARMVHANEWTELCDIIDFSMVGRVQVNSEEADDRAILNLWRFSQHINKPVIMQWRSDFFPLVPGGVQLLQDRSGGTGLAETNWAVPNQAQQRNRSYAPIGYAGGLTPENAATALLQILPASRGRRFWIDCESGLRTDDWFDQTKAERMVEAVRRALPNMFQEGGE